MEVWFLAPGTERFYGRAARRWQLRRCFLIDECRDAPAERLEQVPSVALDQNSTIIAVVEMSQSSWLVGGCGSQH